MPEVSFRWQEPESCLFEKYESVAGSNAQHGGRICSQYSGELLSDVPIEYGNQGSRIWNGDGAGRGSYGRMCDPVENRYRKWRLLWHRQYAADIFKIGITAFGTSLAPTAALIFTNLQCLRYGGNAAVACYAAISYIVFPVQYFLTGIGEGVQPLISFYHGAKKETEVRAVKKIAYTAEIILGITAAAVTICMIPYIGGWFGLSAESKQYFSSGMLISSFAFLLTGTAKLNVSCLNAVMQTKKAVFMTYIESLAVSPICLFLLPGCLGYQRNLAGAPGNGRHYDRNLRVDKKG